MSTAEQEKSIVEDIAVAEIEHYMGGIIEVESDNIPLILSKRITKFICSANKISWLCIGI